MTLTSFSFPKIGLVPSHHSGGTGARRNFWAWGAIPDSSTPKGGRGGQQVFDFRTNRFVSGGSDAFDGNLSNNLSNSQIINDNLSQAEIEKMEIKKKIHDLMKILQPDYSVNKRSPKSSSKSSRGQSDPSIDKSKDASPGPSPQKTATSPKLEEEKETDRGGADDREFIEKVEHKVDINKLRKLCRSKHGLVNDSIRKMAWPLLLNADVLSEQSDHAKQFKIALKDDSEWK